MVEFLELQKQIVPELIKVMRDRLMILQRIDHHQPIGRRALARLMEMTERVLRGEVEVLHENGLIDIQPSGMYLTKEGKIVLNQFFPIIHPINGVNEWEHLLARHLQLHKVYIVPGDSTKNPEVKKDLGRMAAHYLQNNIRENDRIAVTGGTSMAAMADMMVTEHPYPSVIFYPARGGLGEHVDIQANTVAARLANNVGGQYLLLHVPDHLREETYRSLIEEPHVRERVEQIRTARMIFHGIGNARSMAKRRGADQEILQLLEEKKAVSEAFGYYFDESGQIVYQMPTMGLRIEDLSDKICIAVAGGTDKASAIVSLAKTGVFQVLITDEGAANAILHSKI